MGSLKFFKATVDQYGQGTARMCCQWASLESHRIDIKLFKIGDVGDKFYIILHGYVGVSLTFKAKKSDGGDYFDKEVSVLGPGDSFGELALMNDTPRTANLYCKSDVHFAILTRNHYKDILSSD